MDLHVGIDIPSHQISQKILLFFWGGLSYVTINNGGLSTANEISFFRIFKYIYFPALVRFGGEMQHTTSCYLSNNQQ